MTDSCSASCRKLFASSIQIVLRAPGPEVRARLTAAPMTTKAAPPATCRQLTVRASGGRNRADRSHWPTSASLVDRGEPGLAVAAGVMDCMSPHISP